MWRNLAARLFWEQEVMGSNPIFPINYNFILFNNNIKFNTELKEL